MFYHFLGEHFPTLSKVLCEGGYHIPWPNENEGCKFHWHFNFRSCLSPMGKGDLGSRYLKAERILHFALYFFFKDAHGEYGGGWNKNLTISQERNHEFLRVPMQWYPSAYDCNTIPNVDGLHAYFERTLLGIKVLSELEAMFSNMNFVDQGELTTISRRKKEHFATQIRRETAKLSDGNSDDPSGADGEDETQPAEHESIASDEDADMETETLQGINGEQYHEGVEYEGEGHDANGQDNASEGDESSDIGSQEANDEDHELSPLQERADKVAERDEDFIVEDDEGGDRSDGHVQEDEGEEAMEAECSNRGANIDKNGQHR
ncbi:uncharacterized protein RHO25_012543 [Cercospora beticola]|nr:hypothetical protein RHO25_012543 [Cercospora beticola]